MQDRIRAYINRSDKDEHITLRHVLRWLYFLDGAPPLKDYSQDIDIQFDEGPYAIRAKEGYMQE
ncbi:unnamed protein product [Prunus armeniaca]|uniref:Uncharacterized protein n=1 Tax=Prunus armeniaca TaxID=36596 RepID=A0A6J5TKH6_PRUAR|nr:unnamed protein product [Prunus armeniaca]